MKSTLTKLFAYTGLFLVASGFSFAICRRFIPATKTTITIPIATTSKTPSKQTGILVFEGPKTEVCPLNGELFTKAEKDIWSIRRPLTVMVENHADSRPQSGLLNADIIYEAVAEGGITRIMGVFYCNAVKGSENKYDVGPVRSARTYFLDLASEYSDYPLYAHVGGANCSAPTDPVTGKSFACTTDKRALAIEQISDYGWMNKGTWGDLSQFSLSYKVCRREPERTGTIKDTEHTMFCSTKELWNVAADRGLTNMTLIKGTSWDKNYRPWLFKQSDIPGSLLSAKTISFDFWPGYKDYSVTWEFDSSKNIYVRSNGGQKQIDFNTSQAITTKNIVVQLSEEKRSIDVHLHNLYKVIGTGKGLLFQNGTVQNITWSKTNRLSRTIFKNKSGQEVNFVPGLVWVEIIPAGNEVKYEGQS